jgi:uncharacterized protein (TIGR02145 family)
MKKILTTSIIIVALATAIVSCKKDENNNISVTEVTLNKTSDTLVVGQTLTLIATVLPNDATDPAVTWSSSDTNVASVLNGVVTALNKGTATVTVITKDGNKTATCTITVVVPTWNTSLGLASFATTQTWTIGSQTWSDAVQTVDCSNSSSFNGGDWVSSSFNIDCRSNPGQKGDLFSWRAVSEVAELCPEGWRVPTAEDFKNLDIAMGGTGENRWGEGYAQFVTDNYIGRWGGAYGGSCAADGTINSQRSSAAYWSLSVSETNTNWGLNLNFEINFMGSLDFVNPQGHDNKSSGLTLRCVRDN